MSAASGAWTAAWTSESTCDRAYHCTEGLRRCHRPPSAGKPNAEHHLGEWREHNEAVNPSEPYLRQVSQKHLDASTAALTEFSTLVSTTIGRASDSLRVRIGHLDHGAFLNHLVHGFAMLQASPDGLVAGGPGEHEVLYAIVVNQTLDTQMRTALACVASYLARHQLISSFRRNDDDVTGLDTAIVDLDAQVASSLDDTLRVNDWRSATLELRERAIAAGCPLRVRFAAPLMNAEDIKRRVPVVRRVYNEIPAARGAIDRVAAAISLSLTIAGDGVPQAALAAAHEMMDVGEVRRYVAHIVRDAFVCGNGFLEVRPPPSGLRMVRPETMDVRGSSEFVVTDPETGGSRILDGSHLLHLKGIHQTSGPLGVSLLEPLVVYQAQLDVAQSALDDGVPIAMEFGTEDAKAWAERTQAFAARIRLAKEKSIQEVLGGSTTRFPAPPTDLYFPGHEDLLPAAPSLRFVDEADRR
jgi:hypothetical protein